MKKIDLHIHTVASKKDASFTFSIENLEEYVSSSHLDAIAITNHNLFDRNQFEMISNRLSCVVFPGVEVDFAGGHMLVIASQSKIDSFDESCHKIEYLNIQNGESISFQELGSIFGNLAEYLLIPHYQKDPSVPQVSLNLLKEHFFVGEVSNQKKFIRQLKSENPIVPILSSDLRISDTDFRSPMKYTYIKIGDVTLQSIKYALHDKSKVSLSEKDVFLFDILPNGLTASDGLNVILGKRSSGKTHTLNEISRRFTNVKYIRQFDLLETEEEVKAQAAFQNNLSRQGALFSEEYLKEFQQVVSEILLIDLEDDYLNLEQYITSLIQFASHQYSHDAYAKAALFNESPFSIIDDGELNNLISSMHTIIETNRYQTLVFSYITRENAIRLYLELIEIKDDLVYKQFLKKETNSLIQEIRLQLQMKSSTPQIEYSDFGTIYSNRNKVTCFVEIARELKKSVVLRSEDIYGFKIEIKRREIESATEIKTLAQNRSGSFKELFLLYNKPYEYLKSISEKIGVAVSDAYRYFCLISFSALNSDGYPVSGGERAEFNLIHALRDSYKYDMLLIDEPESSFDNIFLKERVNEMIKDLATKMPVFVVTHSNTVGASIRPDYIIYTEKKVTGEGSPFTIYEGHSSDAKLFSIDGKEVPNYAVLIDSLEAGEDSYKERREIYESLNNH